MTSYSLNTNLITAHAIEYGAAIVTGNVEHFRDTGARVEDWNQ